jgi:hypothetical protein
MPSLRYLILLLLTLTASMHATRAVAESSPHTLTRDTRYRITEIRLTTIPAGQDFGFYASHILDNGNIVATDGFTHQFYHWVADSPNAVTGRLHQLPRPISAPLQYAEILSVTDTGRSLFAYTEDTSGITHRYVWQPTASPQGAFSPLPTFGGFTDAYIQSLNDAGEFAGSGRTGGSGPYWPIVFTPNEFGGWSFSMRPSSNERDAGSAMLINDAGETAQRHYDVGGAFYTASRWQRPDGAVPGDFDYLRSPYRSEDATAINDHGWIVGTGWSGTNSNNRTGFGYLWRPSSADPGALEQITLFDNVSGWTDATDINDHGVAIGSYRGIFGRVWSEATGEMELNDMLIVENGLGPRIAQPRSINDRGQIVAIAVMAGSTTSGSDNYVSTVLLTPYASGDVNFDSVVDSEDFSTIVQNYGQANAAWRQGDVSGDTVVDGHDFLAWQRNVTPAPALTGTPVPEPTAPLLFLLAAPLIRRRQAG